MYAVEYGTGKRQEGFATKSDALMWAGLQKLDNFEIFDENDTIVYSEYPQPKWF